MKGRTYLILFTFLLLGTLLVSACQQRDGAFGPIRPTPTLIGQISQQSVPVNFETLNSDPSIFVDRTIQVAGQYVPLRESTCDRNRGPSVDWFLISNELEMNMSGYGSIVEIIPAQSFLTVEGIWRRYEGPVGCAKDLEESVVWYLEVIRILDPNPVVASAFVKNDGIQLQPTSVLSDPDTGSSPVTPQVSATQPVNITVTITSTPTQLPAGGVTSTPTIAPTATTPQTTPVTLTATVIPTATSISQGEGGETPTPDPTGDGNEQTVTPTPTADDGGLGGSDPGTPNPVATNPSGYPGEGTAYP